MKTTSLLLAALATLAWGSAMPEEFNRQLIARQDWADSDIVMVQIIGGEKRYISYGALKRNGIPCSRRGTSFTNCQTGTQGHEYVRGCETATRCARAVNE